MLNTLLDFFRLDNGKEQPRLSPCRISAITHTLETEFIPVAVNKGLSLSVKTGHNRVGLSVYNEIDLFVFCGLCYLNMHPIAS